MGKDNKAFRLEIQEAKEFAKKLSLELKGGEIIGLSGELGAGKTTFVQVLAKELKVKSRVTSPTYVVQVEHKGKLPSNQLPITLVHIDAYRVSGKSTLESLGISERLGDENTITLVEWVEKIPELIPKLTLHLHLHNSNT